MVLGYGSREAKESVISWLSRTYKLFFITISKYGGKKPFERVFVSAPLEASKVAMKSVLKRAMMEWRMFDENVSVEEYKFVENVCRMSEVVTEDLAGAFGHLSLACMKTQAVHYSEWRRYFLASRN